MKTNRQKTYIKEQRSKRVKFIFKFEFIFIMISLFVFLFGYDTSMFDSHKFMEFLPPFIFLILIFIGVKKNPIYKICPQCGMEIKNRKRDCIIGSMELIDTYDKVEYKNVLSTIKGKTVYPRGGYSMRNSVFENTSETIYEVNQKVPFIKKYYVYTIPYRCKNCGELIFNEKIESLKKCK